MRLQAPPPKRLRVSGSVFSETLQSVTDQKLEELSKHKTAFQDQNIQVYNAVRACSDPLSEVRVLLDGVKTCFGLKTNENGSVVLTSGKASHLELKVANIDRFLGQARYDPSISSKLLNDWKILLSQQLDAKSARYEFASLFAQLVTEWLSTEKNQGAAVTDELDDLESYEQIASKQRLESRAEWEQTVFEPLESDQQAITSFLTDLFGESGSNEQAAKALHKIRERMEQFELQLAAPEPFVHRTLQWTLKSLIASDLLSDDQRGVLKDFMGNRVILAEIADVLNMRMTAIDTWTWGNEVNIEQRKKLNGTYQIYMHEDLLQAIFLHFLGIKWSVFFKGVFRDFLKHDAAWASPRGIISSTDQKRRAYYLGTAAMRHGVQSERRNIYRSKYFVTQLLDRHNQEIEMLEGEDQIDFSDEEIKTAAPRQARTKQTASRQMVYGSRAGQVSEQEEVLADEDPEKETDDDLGNQPKNPMTAKQELLHLLATEVLLNTRLHGDFTCFHTEFDRLYSTLPHSTVSAMLPFFGMSERWRNFFTKFMRAPLAFQGEQPRTRTRGIPASHSLSEILSEVLLFCMDFSVNQATHGQHLYRMQEDCWFWSYEHDTCVTAFRKITDFANVMGVSLHRSGTVRTSGLRTGPEKAIHPSLPKGKIRWGFLYLDAKLACFQIDQAIVDRHIAELQKQLSGKENIFSWTMTWNVYANTFSVTNFGRPACCYGQAHIDMILSTLERIQRSISQADGHSSVVESLKARLTQQFDVHNIPDGYMFFPTAFGGLEIRNPFIGLLQIRNAIPANPAQLLDEFEEAEREAYHAAKSRFEKGTVYRRATPLLRDDPHWRPDDPDTFMSFDEFTRYREAYSGGFDHDLRYVFGQLMRQPEPESIAAEPEISSALNDLYTQPHRSFSGGAYNPTTGIHGNWDGMSNYWKWVTQLYGREMIEKFGGLCIVDPGLLPLGMVNLVQSGRVKWKD